jgi:fructokinase
MPVVTCFGEVLWDVFPTHKKIGGAPLNVALRLNSLNIKANIISRIGNDSYGNELLEFLKDKGLNSSNIQIDENYKTGLVQVLLDNNGSASYNIEYPVAWDKIEITNHAVEKIKSSDAFIFGSLVCRDDISRNTLFNLLQHARFKVFDVNIRPPFYSMELLVDLMKKSDFIKCNDDELKEICNSLRFNSESIEDQIRFISDQTQTKQICVTKGKDGAMLFYNDKFFDHKGYQIKVADTVGAGDSFLATLIRNLLVKIDLNEALDLACAMGALVASKKGANPDINIDDLRLFIENSIED